MAKNSTPVTTTPKRPARNDLLPDMELVQVAVKDINLPKHQTRKLKAEHIQEVADTISALGFSVPVLIGKNNTVLDGYASPVELSSCAWQSRKARSTASPTRRSLFTTPTRPASPPPSRDRPAPGTRPVVTPPPRPQ